jgi:hypothetical protein
MSHCQLITSTTTTTSTATAATTTTTTTTTTNNHTSVIAKASSRLDMEGEGGRAVTKGKGPNDAGRVVWAQREFFLLYSCFIYAKQLL